MRNVILLNVIPGNTNWRGRLSTVDLLIKVTCFVKKVNSSKISWSKLVSTRRSTALIHPLQLVFPGFSSKCLNVWLLLWMLFSWLHSAHSATLWFMPLNVVYCCLPFCLMSWHQLMGTPKEELGNYNLKRFYWNSLMNWNAEEIVKDQFC